MGYVMLCVEVEVLVDELAGCSLEIGHGVVAVDSVLAEASLALRTILHPPISSPVLPITLINPVQPRLLILHRAPQNFPIAASKLR